MKVSTVYAVFQETDMLATPAELMGLFKFESAAEEFARDLRIEDTNARPLIVTVIPMEVQS